MAWDQNAGSWTAAELLSDVRRAASLPVTSTDFPDAVLMREATDVLWSYAGWAMQQAGEGRLTDLLERPVTGLLSSAYRAGSELELPPLAIGDTVDAVTWLNAQGTSESRLQRIDASLQPDYDRPGATGAPQAYALLGSRIRLYPRPDQGGTVRLTYQRRHPHLIADTTTTVGTLLNAATTIAPGITQFTLTSDVSMGLMVLDTVDLLSGQAPYRPLATGLSVWSVNLALLQLQIPLSTLSGLNLYGVRVVRSGQSPYVHYPLELRASVTEKIAANVMRRFGDLTNAQASEQIALGELQRVITMLSPRVKRDRPKVVNPYSHLRMGMRGTWRPR